MSQFKILNLGELVSLIEKAFLFTLNSFGRMMWWGRVCVCGWGGGEGLTLLLELDLIEIGLWFAPKFNLIYLLLIYLFVCLFLWHRLVITNIIEIEVLKKENCYFFQFTHKYIIMCAIFLITVNIQCIWYK